MKATLVVALVFGLVCFVGAFQESFEITQFLDSQPHPIIRADFDFQAEAIGNGYITIDLIADLGYFKLFSYTTPDASIGPFSSEINYEGSSSAYLRNVKIWLRTPSGSQNIYLGKFFDENQYNNGGFLYSLYFNSYSQRYPNAPNYYDNFYSDTGFYNTKNHLGFSIDAPIWEQITREGSASLLFEFSSDVASYYLVYPFNNVYNHYYPGEEFLRVSIFYDEASIVGDPHFHGWNGAVFDFQGENQHIYNLISHRETQVNFQMKQRNFFSVTNMAEIDSLSHNTFVGTIGLKSKSHQLVLFSGESGFEDAGYIELDGVRHEISREKTMVHSDAELTVQFLAPVQDLHEGKDPVAAVLEINIGIYHLKVFFIESGRNPKNLAEWHSHPFRFFNTYASITDRNHILQGRMHGVLGQTGDEFLSQKLSGAENWSIEGTFDDYRVSDMFASDFKYNLFAHRKN